MKVATSEFKKTQKFRNKKVKNQILWKVVELELESEGGGNTTVAVVVFIMFLVPLIFPFSYFSILLILIIVFVNGVIVCCCCVFFSIPVKIQHLFIPKCLFFVFLLFHHDNSTPFFFSISSSLTGTVFCF